MKKLLGIVILGLLWCNNGYANKLPAKLFGIKIYDHSQNYVNINTGKISETRPGIIFFLNTQETPFKGLVKNINLDTYQLRADEKYKVLSITGLKNFGEVSSKNFQDRCKIESYNFKKLLANNYNKNVSGFTKNYYKKSTNMGRDYLFLSNELRFNKDSKKLMVQIMCSYTSIYNYVHSTMYISLVDQDYWEKGTLQNWKRIKPFNNILIRLNLTN
tara:strand:- start:39 stop:686 length:648 start_codon:yes stop_codon:yes gene_type:complete